MTETSNSSYIPLPSHKDFIAGSLAGMAQIMIGHPLDTVKVRLQLNPAYKGAWDCLLQTIKREGILGLYKGMASPLAGISIVNAVLFSAYGWMKNVQSSNGGQLLSIREIAVAGAFAGIVNSFVLSPVELFKIRLQAEHSSSSVRILKGPMDVARQLIHQHGWANGVFRGTLATIYREIPACAGFYAGFEWMKRKLTPKSNLSQQQLQQQPLSLGRIMIAGSFGGFCYWTCCYPLDVIKSRIQNDLAAPTRIFPVAQSIMTEGGGVKALFRGYGTTILRSLPAAAATFTVVELTQQLMK